MPGNELLNEMLARLDAGVGDRLENRLYYHARQPYAYVTPEDRKALHNRFGRLAANACRVSIQSVCDRLRIIGFRSSQPMFEEFLRLDLDTLAEVVHTEMLVQGSSFLLIWVGADGNPTVTVESAESVAVKRDPVTREVVAAIKRVEVRPSPTTQGYTEVWLYLPDEVIRFRGSLHSADLQPIESIPNPLGKVPVVPFVNSTLLPSNDSEQYQEDTGVSDLDDLKPLVDSLNHILASQQTAIEWTARPRRWATGVKLTERLRVDEAGEPVLNESGGQIYDVISPVALGKDMATFENEQARLGQLEGARLDGFTNAANLVVQQIMMVTGMTAGMCGITTANPATAEAMRTGMVNMTAKSESIARRVSRSWEAAMRLIWAVKTGADPESVDVRVVWGDPAFNSLSAEGDAASKLFGSTLMSRTTVLRRQGFTDDEIEQEFQNFARDADLEHDLSIARILRK